MVLTCNCGTSLVKGSNLICIVHACRPKGPRIITEADGIFKFPKQRSQIQVEA